MPTVQCVTQEVDPARIDRPNADVNLDDRHQLVSVVQELSMARSISAIRRAVVPLPVEPVTTMER